MNTPTKLDEGQKHFMRLIQRDKKPDGWTTVSAVLFECVTISLPEELAEFERNDDGSGRARLTELGEQIVDAMLYL